MQASSSFKASKCSCCRIFGALVGRWIWATRISRKGMWHLGPTGLTHSECGYWILSVEIMRTKWSKCLVIQEIAERFRTTYCHAWFGPSWKVVQSWNPAKFHGSHYNNTNSNGPHIKYCMEILPQLFELGGSFMDGFNKFHFNRNWVSNLKNILSVFTIISDLGFWK